MARRATLINTATKGELDPDLGDRQDLAHFYNSVRRGREVVFAPQGGIRRRPTLALSRPILRNKLEPIPLTSTMLTAHNGGTKENLIDQDPETAFTTNAVNSNSFVVIEADLGEALPVCFVDVVAFKSQNNQLLDNVLAVEWYNGTSWVSVDGPDDAELSPRRHLRSIARTRRFGGAPGTAVTAQNWRVVIYDSSGKPGTITVGNLRLWREKDAISALKLIDFAKSAGETYQLALTDRNIDVFDDGEYLASIPVAIGYQQIDEVNTEQSQDTLLLFHADVETIRIVRQGSADEWDVGPAPLDNLPNLTADTAFSGEQDEVQDIRFPTLTAGQKIVLFLGDQMTEPIEFSSSGDLPDDIIDALAALPDVAPNVPEVIDPPAPAEINLIATLRSTNPLIVRLRFTEDNGGRAWPPVLPVLLEEDDDTASTEIVQRGIDPAGAIASKETGWPRAGAFNHSRLQIGGMRSAPQTIATSRAGDPYDFTNTGDPITADLGFLDTLDTDKIETIRDIFIGRHLQVFTESGEWWLENRSLDATQPRNWILATRNGAAANVPLVFGENSTFFIQDGGRILRDFLYSDVAQNYEAEPLSLLGPHLLTNVIDMAYRKATTTTEANLAVLVNDDGTFGLLSLLRSQEVIAISGNATPHGAVRAVICDTNRRLWMGVERAGRLTLEKDYSGTLDSAVFYNGAPIDTMTGLDHLEGLQVYAWVDGDIYGPFVVDDGEVDLGVEGSDVVCGLAVIPVIETQALRERLQNERPFRPPARVYECELSLADTGEVLLGANGQELVDVPLRRWDGGPPPEELTGDEPDNDHFDVPLLERLFTGKITVEDLEGYTDHARLRVTQARPAPFHLRSMRYEIAYA